ncbi:MAG TPA: hypothetical protein VFQ90_09070 [Stellaceae bacterium]|jgi:hypothetical protein|nr:hypothetical protein [Stellaceae bacterium]
MRVDKKEEELGYLNSLRHLCDDFPPGEVIASECPDFLIRSSIACVGIEITKIFKNRGEKTQAPQSIEAARDRITDLAKRFAEEMGMPPATVTLFFNHTRPLYRQQEANIAKAVAQAVNDELPPLGEHIELNCGHGSVQPTEVDGILVYRASDQHQWRWMEYSRIERNVSSYIEAAIHDKSSRIEAYRRECQICWLLIVAESFRDSGNLKPDELSLSRTYRSPFDRTYFFDNGFGKLARLNTVLLSEDVNA